jgi:hypothetical protein
VNYNSKSPLTVRGRENTGIDVEPTDVGGIGRSEGSSSKFELGDIGRSEGLS